MRSFRPAGIWLVAPPVWVATQSHGCGDPHNVGADVPQAVEPLLRPYVGEQPRCSSSFSVEMLGSQSTDWFCEPTTTRSCTGGSLALASSSTSWMPIRTTTPLTVVFSA